MMRTMPTSSVARLTVVWRPGQRTSSRWRRGNSNMVSRADQKMALKKGPSTQKKARVTSSRQSRKARCSSFSILLMAFLLMAFSQPTVTEGCQGRSEERRVGKECRWGWGREHEKEKREQHKSECRVSTVEAKEA